MTIRLDRAAIGALADAVRSAEHCVLVSVDRIEGSAPREAGAAMLVSVTKVYGTIGGGHLELKSIALAREMLTARLAGRPQGPVVRRFPLGPALGQCCGGVAHVRFDHCDSGVPPAGADVAPVTSLFTLYLFGAGHVGQALVQALTPVECDIVWIDAREQQFPSIAPPQVRVEASDNPEDEVKGAPSGAFYLVMTHSHALDLVIVERILRRGDAGFVGLIGSATKRATFERRLRERGFGSEALSRLVCPVGIEGVRGKAPGVVAIAVAAQLLSLVAVRERALPVITAL